MENFKDIMAFATFGARRSTAHNTWSCVCCKGPADPESFRDDISRREYEISALCQDCQDAIFQEPAE